MGRKTGTKKKQDLADKNDLESDKKYQEWKACNEAISKLDTILIDIRRYGFSVATGLTTAGAVLTQFTQFQPLQLVLVFATMALIDVLYWLDVYYQTVLSAVILRTQVLECRLQFGLDVYISRFYMRHKIGKALHLLYVGFLVYLAILGAQIIISNNLVSSTGITLIGWILFLSFPVVFIFSIWYFFDRRRYRTYVGAQEIASNFLRNGTNDNPQTKRTIDQEITEFLDSDKEDLGLDLEIDEWVFYDETETRWWLWPWSRRLIVTNKRIYAIKTSPWLRKWLAAIEYDNCTIYLYPKESRSFTITEAGVSSLNPNFKIKINEKVYPKIYDEVQSKIIPGASQNKKLVSETANKFRLDAFG